MEYNIPANLGISALTGSKDGWITWGAGWSGRGSPWDNTYSNVWRRAGKDLRREIMHLARPLYTDSMTMSKFTFSAEKFSGDDGLRWSLGHDINILFELYGCPNYDLDRSKCHVRFSFLFYIKN